MGLYDQFSTDPDIEKEGVILDYGDFRVRVGYAGSSNKKFINYQEKKLKPLRHAINTGALSEERSRIVMADIYAETLIYHWETAVGEPSEDGERVFKEGIEPKEKGAELLPFNKENVARTLRNLPALFSDIQSQAGSVASFRGEEMKADSGN